MKMTNAALSALSLAKHTCVSLAKHTCVAATVWVVPSALLKPAHLLERVGLAMVGGACGLFMAAGFTRPGNELFAGDWFALLIMLYGAFGFYIGVDLPQPSCSQNSPDTSGRVEGHRSR
jgi:hypothetical protein